VAPGSRQTAPTVLGHAAAKPTDGSPPAGSGSPEPPSVVARPAPARPTPAALPTNRTTAPTPARLTAAAPAATATRAKKSQKKPRARPATPGKGASGKSRFPALAGFWGRRDTQGDLVPLTDPGLSPLAPRYLTPTGSSVRPRRPRGQGLAIVLASACLSFALAWGLLEWRRPRSSSRPRPVDATTTSAPATHDLPSAKASLPLTAPAPADPRAAAPRDASALPSSRPARSPRPRPNRRAVPPAHGEDELLPPSP
jgi:hypothetical protein